MSRKWNHQDVYAFPDAVFLHTPWTEMCAFAVGKLVYATHRPLEGASLIR